MLLTSSVPLFLGGLVADIAYALTYEVQWTNFAAWLVAGAMVFTGLALAWSLIQVVRRAFRERHSLLLLAVLAATFVLGLLNSFMHARDAWASMPAGLVQSLLVTALAIGALWLSLLAPRRGAAA